MSVDMQTFLDSAVNDAVGVRVRCGESKNPRTIGIVLVGDSPIDPARYANFDATSVESWEEAFDSVTEMLDGIGWGIEPGEECARLHLLGEKGNQLRTWSRTQWPENQGVADTHHLLAGEIIRMAAELRKAFISTTTIQSETIQALSETNINLRAEALDSYRAEVEAEAEAALTATLAEIDQGAPHPEDPLRDTAAGIIQGIASQFLPGTARAPIDAKSLILETLRNDPNVVRELADDPEMLELLLKAENGAPIPDVPEVEATPNPMDE
jgi:hypothetical protein